MNLKGAQEEHAMKSIARGIVQKYVTDLHAGHEGGAGGDAVRVEAAFCRDALKSATTACKHEEQWLKKTSCHRRSDKEVSPWSQNLATEREEEGREEKIDEKKEKRTEQMCAGPPWLRGK